LALRAKIDFYFKINIQIKMLTKKANQDDFFSRLSILMENDEIKQFFKDYFKNWSDSKATLMMINTYIFLETEYESRNGFKPDQELVCELLKKAMMNGECRKIIVDSMSEYINNKSNNFKLILDKIEHKQLN